MKSQNFGPKLDLVLKAVSMSRAQLAAALEVDKSLIGRWLSGAVIPSAHNLTRLTQFIAAKRDGFSLFSWEEDIESLAVTMGVHPARPIMPFTMPAEVVGEARDHIDKYAGIWRLTSSAGVAEAPDLFVHGYAIMRPANPGLLSCKCRMFDIRTEGWIMMVHNQLYATTMELETGRLHSIILNGLAGVKVDIMDGIGVSCRGELGGLVLAWALIVERVADLSDDPEADEQRYNTLGAQNPAAPEGSIPLAIRNQLLRDVGPKAAEAGGELLLYMPAIRSLARAAAGEAATSEV